MACNKTGNVVDRDFYESFKGDLGLESDDDGLVKRKNEEVKMKVFTGRYSWDGKKHDREEPIAWFPGTYNLKIFNLSETQSAVTHLKPHICIYSPTGEGISISANPEKFAKHICHDFSLEMEKVLWAEERQDNSGVFDIVVFTEKGRMGDICFYSIEKRQPLAGEKRVIEKELAALQERCVSPTMKE